jgi:hypothetical protein
VAIEFLRLVDHQPLVSTNSLSSLHHVCSVREIQENSRGLQTHSGRAGRNEEDMRAWPRLIDMFD